MTFTVSQNNFVNPTYSLSDPFSGTTILNSDINSSGIFNWIPTASDIGSHTITIYASDFSGHSANTVEQITVSQSSSTSQPVLSQSSVSLATGQTSTISITGSGNYYVASNSNPSAATVVINGSIATISGLTTTATLPSGCTTGYLFSPTTGQSCSISSAGVSSVSICQSGGQCVTLNITVTQGTAVTSISQTATSYIFTKNLKYNDKGADVLALQKILVKLGFLTTTPNGHYGPATVTAVKKLQAAHKIRQLGSFGPATMALLNQLKVIVK